MMHFLVGNLSRNTHLLLSVQGFSDKKKKKLKLSQTAPSELVYPSHGLLPLMLLSLAGRWGLIGPVRS